MSSSSAGWLFILALVPAFAAENESVTVIHPVAKEVVLARLRQAAHDNRGRESKLKKLLEEAGCSPERLEEQPVKHLQVPNLICTLPGAAASRILVSAHTDKVTQGDGTVDDWSGAAMLPDLVESLRHTPRRHTFVFRIRRQRRGIGRLQIVRETNRARAEG